MIIYCENGHKFTNNIRDHIKTRQIICLENGTFDQLYFQCGVCHSKQHITFLNQKCYDLQAKIQEHQNRNEISTMMDYQIELKTEMEVLKKLFTKFITDFKE